MGVKTKLVKEEYFILEIDDVEIEIERFIHLHNDKPKIVIVHPDNYEQIQKELLDKIILYTGDLSNGKVVIYGVEVISSYQIKLDKLEII